MNEKQARKMLEALGQDAEAPVGKQPRWKALIESTKGDHDTKETQKEQEKPS